MKRILLLASLLVSFQVLFAQPRSIQRHFWGLTLGETYTPKDIVKTLANQGVEVIGTDYADGVCYISLGPLSFGGFDWTGVSLHLFDDKQGVLSVVQFSLLGKTAEDLMVIEDELVSKLVVKYGKPQIHDTTAKLWFSSSSFWNKTTRFAMVDIIKDEDGTPFLSLSYALTEGLLNQSGLDEL